MAPLFEIYMANRRLRRTCSEHSRAKNSYTSFLVSFAQQYGHREKEKRTEYRMYEFMRAADKRSAFMIFFCLAVET